MKNNKRIAFFHNLPSGGAKRVLYEQVKGLGKKYTVDIYQLQPTGDDFLDFSKLSCNIYTYNFKLETSIPKPFKRFALDYKNFITLSKVHQQIAQSIDTGTYDAVIVHHDKYTQAPFILQHLKTKSVYYCEELLRIAYEHELSPITGNIINQLYERGTRLIRKRIDKNNAVKASTIITNSKHIQQKIKHAYGRDAVVCYPGVDTNVFHHIPQKRSTLLFFGEPVDINGYDLVKEIIDQLPPSIHVQIINFFGKGKKITDNMLSSLYSQAIATLCLGKNEPFGLTPVESMACKTPVIALNEGGYKETVEHGKTGFLIPRDTKKLLQAINTLVQNPTLVEKLGNYGRSRVLKYFTWEKHVACLEKYL